MIIKLLITSTIILTSLNSFSQDTNELRFYYGISDSELLRNDELDGAGANDIKNVLEFGSRYLRRINENLSLETGVNYTKADLDIIPAYMGVPVQNREETFELISIPVYVNYTLWHFLFINGGPILDFQMSENTADSQSGIGYGAGIGGKYNFNNFLIYVNPNFKRHAVLPFEKENHHQKLTEVGIQLGLGFKF